MKYSNYLQWALLAALLLQAACQDEADAAVGEVEEELEDPCAAESLDDYNLGLHIGSVFILLGVSLLGSMLPVILGHKSSNPTIVTLVKLGTFFGFGTILATAFIHMLTPAAEKLSSECLPESFTESYEAWPYLFALIAIFTMQLVDYGVEGAYHSMLSRKASFASPQDGKGPIPSVYASHPNLATMDEDRSHHGHDHAHDLHHHEHTHDLPAAVSDEETGSVPGDEEACKVHGHGCKSLLAQAHTSGPVDASAVAGIYIMEGGILAHSLLIGIALGVTSGSSFVTLLIALSFHQAFEGFAIGSASVDAGLTLKKASILGLLYSLTTPIGIAIGIGIRSSYNGNSDSALYVEGIFDGLSAGILIYVGLVELLNPLMTQSKWIRAQRWYIQVLSFGCLYFGAACMAVIGKWA